MCGSCLERHRDRSTAEVKELRLPAAFMKQQQIMWTTLCVFCVLGVTPILCALFEGCPRKEPPPGVVIVSLGSELVLSCSGHVTVDGAKVVSSQGSALPHLSKNSVSQNEGHSKQHFSMNQGKDGQITPTNSFQNVSQPFRDKSDWDIGDNLFKDDDEGEKGEMASKLNIQWKFNSKDMVGSIGSTLFLSHVTMSDSGHYSCHHGATDRFSTRVLVADTPETPETPHLSCYKKSPSSKIRCEWTPTRAVHKGTSCFLLIHRGEEGGFLRETCSFSTRRSRCWCALDFDIEDRWKLYQAVLCVSSFISNTTSDILKFKPFDILKPDPPYNISVQPQEGLSQSLMIKWKPPNTWKLKDGFYALIYEIRYKPLSSAYFQSINLSTIRHRVTDALAGQEYEVQVRTKDEYYGLWSEWSDPQYGRSWIEMPQEYLITTPGFPYWYSEGSGTEDPTEVSTATPQVVSHHHLWMIILASVGIPFTIFAVCIIRYKHKCKSKIQSLGVLAQCGDSVHPQPSPVPAVAEGHALLNQDQPQNEVKDSSQQELRDEETIPETNFNNTSYFFLHTEL